MRGLVGLFDTTWLLRGVERLRSLAMALDGPGLFLVALADSSFLSIPEGNDILIVVLSTGQSWERMGYYVAMTTMGSLCGCLLLYSAGRKGGNPLLRRRFSEKNVEKAERMFRHYGMLTVLVPSILPPPCPFKIFVLSAGVFRLSWSSFIVAVTVGRTVRYSMWGILAVLYGNTVKVFMQQNLAFIGIFLFIALVLVILGVVYHRIIRWRRRRLGSTR